MTYRVVSLGLRTITAATPVVAGPPGPPGADGKGAVDSVNGQTGTVVLAAADVGADAAGAAAAAQAASQPLDADLTAIAALITTAFGRSVLTQADAAALRALASLGTAATQNTGAFDAAGAAAAAQAASQPLDADLTAIAALVTTAFGRSVLTQADAAALRALAGLGTAATQNTGAFDAAGAAAAAQAASQPLDADLTAIAALSTTVFGRALLALADAAALRAAAGLGTAALNATGDFIASTLPDAKGDLIAATADNAPARVAVGANSARLLGDSAQSTGLRWSTSLSAEGSGDPEGVVTAPVGSTYQDTTNGWMYKKITGSGNTGWVGVGTPVPRQAPPSGSYLFPHSQTGSTASNTLGNGTLRLGAVFVPYTYNIVRIGAEVTVIGDVGSKLRLGIFADTGAGRPGALVLDAGQIAGDSATVQEIVLGSTLVLPRGWYWMGGVVQAVTTTQPTVRNCSAFDLTAPIYGTATIPAAGATYQGYSQNSVTGSLPGTFTTGVGTIAAIPRLFFKLA